MANTLKIAQCIATPGYVIVYFSERLDFPGAADPTKPGTYSVWELMPVASSQTPPPLVVGPRVAVTNVFFDRVIGRTVVLQLGSLQLTGQMLQVQVDARATSKLTPITAAGRLYSVQVNAKDKPTNDEELKKILQPPYAIGMGLISRDDYNNVKNEYFSQSELSLGLILPMVLIVLGLVLTPQLGLAPPTGDQASLWDLQTLLKWLAWAFMCAAMIPISQVLFMIGMELYHKFRLEVKLLILGNWQKQQDAKATTDKTNSSSSSKTQDAVAKAIAHAIIAAGGIQKLNVNVDTKV